MKFENSRQREAADLIVGFLDRHGPSDDIMMSDLILDQEDLDLDGDDFEYALRLLCCNNVIRWRAGRMGFRVYYLTYGKDEIPRTICTWNQALDWARSRGVKLKKGKITKYTAWMRIYDAGLMDEFNHEWPDYSFNKQDVDSARSSENDRIRRYIRQSINGGIQ